MKTRGNKRSGREGSAAARVHGGRLEPRRSPRQERARITVEAILEAGAELFGDLGYARTTTNRIAERAGVSIGTLYQYFPGKDAVLARLLEDHHHDVHEALAASLEELSDPATDLEQGLRRLMERLVALHLENPKVTRALRADVLAQSEVGTLRHGEAAEFNDVVAGMLARRPDVRDGVHRAMAAVIGQATGNLTRWLIHEAPPDLERAVLLEESVLMLHRYLSAGLQPDRP